MKADLIKSKYLPTARLITLTSFGFSANSEWPVKSENLHQESFSSTIRVVCAFVCTERGSF